MDFENVKVISRDGKNRPLQVESSGEVYRVGSWHDDGSAREMMPEKGIPQPATSRGETSFGEDLEQIGRDLLDMTPEIAGATAGAESGVAAMPALAPFVGPYAALAPVAGAALGGAAAFVGKNILTGRPNSVGETGEALQRNAFTEGTGRIAVKGLVEPAARGIGKAINWAKDTGRAVFAPSKDPLIKSAEVAAKEAGITLTPGERGSRFGATVEGYALKDPLTAVAQGEKAAVKKELFGKLVEKKFPAERPDKIGESFRKGNEQATELAEQQISDAYEGSRTFPSKNIGERASARKGVLAVADEILGENGMLIGAEKKGLKAITKTAGDGANGTVIAKIDPRVANAIAALRNSEELTGKLDPAAIERVRQSMYSAGKRFTVDRIDAKSMAAWERIYGALKESQIASLSPEGRPILEAADGLFKSEIETAKKLKFLEKLDPQDVVDVFQKQTAEQLVELEKRSPESFNMLRARVIRDAVDDSASVAAFDARIEKLGAANVARFFPDLKGAREAVALKQTLRFPTNASNNPGQGDLRVTPKLTEWPMVIAANSKLVPWYEKKVAQGFFDQPASPNVQPKTEFPNLLRALNGGERVREANGQKRLDRDPKLAR